MSKTAKTIKRQYRINPEENELLVKDCELTGKSVSEYTRDAVRFYRENRNTEGK